MRIRPISPFRTLLLKRRAAARLALAVALAAATALAACSKPDDGKTVGQKLDAVVLTTENKATELRAEARQSAASANVAMQLATQDVKAAAVRAGQAVEAGASDMAITAAVAAGLARDPDLSITKIDIDTTAGTVSIYGPAPSESARSRATSIARAVKGVVAVENKLTLKSS